MLKIGLSTTSIETRRTGNIIDGMGHYTEQLYRTLPSRNLDVIPYSFPTLFGKAELAFSQELPRSYPMQVLGAKIGLSQPIDIPVDIFHATDFRCVPMQCPTVTNIWDALAVIHPKWLFREMARRITIPMILKTSAQFSDMVICSSEYAADEVAHYFELQRNRIRVVAWCIAEQWKNKIPPRMITAVQKKYRLPKQYILSVGTIQPKKNHIRLIDAFVNIPEIERKKIALVIIGKLGRVYHEILAKINDNKASVIHLDNVNSDDDLRCIYQGAKMLAFPTLHEGFGMPVLEGFASRIPVVTSTATAVPEVAGDAAILVNPQSISELTAALRAVLSDQNLAESLITKGNSRLDLFTEDRMINETIKVYQELL